MKRLKNVIVYDTFSRYALPKLLSLLPHDLESLEIQCYSFRMEEIEKAFYTKFPIATLTMNAQ